MSVRTNEVFSNLISKDQTTRRKLTNIVPSSFGLTKLGKSEVMKRSDTSLRNFIQVILTSDWRLLNQLPLKSVMNDNHEHEPEHKSELVGSSGTQIRLKHNKAIKSQ